MEPQGLRSTEVSRPPCPLLQSLPVYSAVRGAEKNQVGASEKGIDGMGSGQRDSAKPHCLHASCAPPLHPPVPELRSLQALYSSQPPKNSNELFCTLVWRRSELDTPESPHKWD